MKKFLLIGALLMQSVLAYATTFENVVSHSKGIAITFDACDGQTDMRILELIAEEKIPVTVFVTGKWIDKNTAAVNFIKSNASYFQIENHGLNHLEAVENQTGMYRLKTVVDQTGLETEVLGNQKKIQEVFGVDAEIYRTAGAMYDKQSVSWIHEHGIQIGGYTVAADEGAKASKEKIVNNLSKVANGDVVLMHINHPHSSVYEGFKEGLKIMQSKGLNFQFLESGDENRRKDDLKPSDENTVNGSVAIKKIRLQH